ncbi:hypothetical protein GWI33_022623 [Rhynchophorus ferrugineus]|uniref:Uncharacterized protein n=1 Tax=Rhynchophorus ferrugineus TaxID=354439 RepID=A0A834LZ89_RHYFE|nr:hypothetical protein GWI33_022624 [Rhynchophorus ferrugineus]KAF7264673.1 hypothetical protein GWI33_022623 [Rhynchophorus ferrugineus]
MQTHTLHQHSVANMSELAPCAEKKFENVKRKKTRENNWTTRASKRNEEKQKKTNARRESAYRDASAPSDFENKTDGCSRGRSRRRLETHTVF